ncbi:MAG: YigZ family protein [Chlorobi bacterium]|nr:YigZ family protein [Chlorobiota bacterium]
MPGTDTYKTIKEPSEGIYKEKGSKFLAFAYPVFNEDEIKKYISELKKEYHDARHHCYSWKLGMDDNHYRMNDDGEPSGTAGKPIYGQILSYGLTNVLVVVVRYFGGTKLGTSGLIHAYKTATKDAFENAEVVEKTVNDIITVSFDYGVMNDVMRIVKDEEPEVVSQDFNLDCRMVLSVRQSHSPMVVKKLKKLESVKVEVNDND